VPISPNARQIQAIVLRVLFIEFSFLVSFFCF
jgi:hypothetical protein